MKKSAPSHSEALSKHPCGDRKGNLGKGPSIHYNLLNLPDSIGKSDEYMRIDYVFGGEKIRKEVIGEAGAPM